MRNKPDKPVLFVSTTTDENDIATGVYLTSKWGRWLTEHLNTVFRKPADKYWYYHPMQICGNGLNKSAIGNCRYHFERVLQSLSPRKIILLGNDCVTHFKKYKQMDHVVLPHPKEFCYFDNPIAHKTFELLLKSHLIPLGLLNEQE